MKPLYLTLFGGGLLLAGGCSSGTCADLNSANQAVANKFASCFSQDPEFFAGPASPCFDQNACDANVRSCSSADQKIFEAQVACQNSYANNSDCSFAAWTAENDCAAAAAASSDGGSLLGAMCDAQFASNPGNCGPDAG